MPRRTYFLGLAISVLTFVCLVLRTLALDVPPVPTTVPVVDQTNILSTEQVSSLATTIANERAKSSNQIAILMIPTLQGDALEDYSLRVARSWGIGTKEHNNGVLLLIVKDDHRLRIEVGYGLEGSLTDARASQIIRDQITPEFRQNRFYDGINAGLQAIIAAIHNEYTSKSINPNLSNPFKAFDWEFMLFAVFCLMIWFSAILARSKSWWAGGVVGGLIGGVVGITLGVLLIGIIAVVGFSLFGLFFDWAVSRNYKNRTKSGGRPSWWAGGTRFGGGFGGSGGFGGFGGGGFGGGGSSGSW